MGKSWFGTGQEPFARCHYSNCNATRDKTTLSTSDAVMFHLQFMKYDFQFPKRTNWKQKWVVFNHEPPTRSYFKRFNGIFNATMTYHRSSEIWANYSQLFGAKLVRRKASETYKVDRNFGKSKSKLIAWFAGDCGGSRYVLILFQTRSYHVNIKYHGEGIKKKRILSPIVFCF